MLQAWTKKGETLVYDGWRKMLRKHFALPDGQSADFDILHSQDYVTVAALTTEGHFIMVREFRPGPECILTSFPEGAVNEGEQPEEAARRELVEETGYEATNLFYLRCKRSAYTTQRQHLVLATGCKPVGKQQLDDREFIEVFQIPVHTFFDWLETPD